VRRRTVWGWLWTSVAGLASVAVGACHGGGTGAQGGDGGGDAGAGVGDAAADAPPACPPVPLDEWAAPAYRPAQPRQPLACSAIMIQDFYASCLGPDATNEGCNQTWGAGEDSAHQTCQSCLVTQSSATAWGPLVNYGTTVSVNVAGCIELLDPSQGSCAASVQAADVCQHAACDGACPVDPADPTSFGKWQSCVAATAQGECNQFLVSAACAGSEDAGPAAACVDGKTFADDFLAIATVFCGSASD
jgi:hypothetical protein